MIRDVMCGLLVCVALMLAIGALAPGSRQSPEQEKSDIERLVAAVRPELTPEQQAYNDRFHAQLKADRDKAGAERLLAVVAIRTLRDAMNDPKSFELVQALRMSSGVLCLTYRATNGFNAVMTNRALVEQGRLYGGDRTNEFIERWNRVCGSKSGDDITHVRQAL